MTTISLYIDADACPVKQEIYRVVERHARKGTALKVFVVSNFADHTSAPLKKGPLHISDGGS
ncbi:MAG: hypothetical protein WB760_07425 [Xanthobacteraceae bacterium]